MCIRVCVRNFRILEWVALGNESRRKGVWVVHVGNGRKCVSVSMCVNKGRKGFIYDALTTSS